MKNYYTISDFTQYLITKYEIENNKNNFRAVRTKVVRTIEELKINLVKSEPAALIRRADCLTIEYQLTRYLLKRSSISKEKLDEYFKYVDDYYEREKEIDEYYEELASMTQDEQIEKMRENELGYIKPVSDEQITRAMITALFNLFFEPIDIEQWNKDHEWLETAFNITSHELDITDIETFRALERYNNPHMYYTKKRERPLI
jgi:putative uncharacterized protein orf8